MTTDLTILWHTNRRWRAWMDAHTPFKTPDTLDCLRYSLIESCEALDAFLRAKNPDHARNNGREHTVESELADTAMLLLTALPAAWVDYVIAVPRNSIDDICLAVAETVAYFRRAEQWENRASNVLRRISTYPGLDLAAELDRCWRRLAVKHGMTALARWLGEQGQTMESIGLIHFEDGAGNWWPAPWLVEESDS